ncbi:MAG: acetyltransferase [Pseudomonadota bacterium]
MSSLDISANRAAQKWTRREQVGRILWALVSPLFRLSPRPLWGWRRMLLNLFGAKIGQDVHIYPTVRVTIPWNLDIGDEAAVGDHAILYALGPIRIGSQATVSQYAHLCAGGHDYINPAMTLTKPEIIIGSGAWVCADAYVGGGVTIGEKAIAAARSVVVKDVPDNVVVGGNPATPIKTRAPKDA